MERLEASEAYSDEDSEFDADQAELEDDPYVRAEFPDEDESYPSEKLQ